MSIEICDENGDFVGDDLSGLMCYICADIYKQYGYSTNYGQIAINLMLAGF